MSVLTQHLVLVPNTLKLYLTILLFLYFAKLRRHLFLFTFVEFAVLAMSHLKSWLRKAALPLEIIRIHFRRDRHSTFLCVYAVKADRKRLNIQKLLLGCLIVLLLLFEQLLRFAWLQPFVGIDCHQIEVLCFFPNPSTFFCYRQKLLSIFQFLLQFPQFLFLCKPVFGYLQFCFNLNYRGILTLQRRRKFIWPIVVLVFHEVGPLHIYERICVDRFVRQVLDVDSRRVAIFADKVVRAGLFIQFWQLWHFLQGLELVHLVLQLFVCCSIRMQCSLLHQNLLDFGFLVGGFILILILLILLFQLSTGQHLYFFVKVVFVGVLLHPVTLTSVALPLTITRLAEDLLARNDLLVLWRPLQLFENLTEFERRAYRIVLTQLLMLSAVGLNLLLLQNEIAIQFLYHATLADQILIELRAHSADGESLLQVFGVQVAELNLAGETIDVLLRMMLMQLHRLALDLQIQLARHLLLLLHWWFLYSRCWLLKASLDGLSLLEESLSTRLLRNDGHFWRPISIRRAIKAQRSKLSDIYLLLIEDSLQLLITHRMRLRRHLFVFSLFLDCLSGLNLINLRHNLDFAAFVVFCLHLLINLHRIHFATLLLRNLNNQDILVVLWVSCAPPIPAFWTRWNTNAIALNSSVIRTLAHRVIFKESAILNFKTSVPLVPVVRFWIHEAYHFPFGLYSLGCHTDPLLVRHQGPPHRQQALLHQLPLI